MKKNSTLITLMFYFTFFHVSGKEKITNNNTKSINFSSSTGCSPSSSYSDLDIGNVRARIFINGDMWWDLTGNAIYEIPKGSGKNSLFSGALWFGGKDGAGNLKVSAQTYRQSGSDFWPGPVDTTTGNITSDECLNYNRQWKITRQEVIDFNNNHIPTQVIMQWPANGNPIYNESHFLAPFYDRVGDGIYDYTDGDYPEYDLFGFLPPGVKNKLNGDQTIWWVFNDVGNIHTETGSIIPIGLEIRAQAYAFCTTDSDLSNTTFYSYVIINRSSTILNETYIGQFVDVDLGNYLDDYVGCDVGRNLGYGYNGDGDDDGVLGYGTVLPAVGVDILQGPIADINDSIDNDHDSIIDEPGEEIRMSKFMYYNNDNTNIGNPNLPHNYYDYMDGKWKDFSPLLFGGNGYQTAGAPICNYMFPGNSDPLHYGTNGVDPGFDWTENTPCTMCPPNAPGDRRFVMSSGKLTILPGEVIDITKAAVWARIPGGIDSSVAALKRADDKIQNFFNSNFTSIPTCLLTNGINDIQQISHSVFPSPATDCFVIRFAERSKKIFVKVFSSDGKLIYKVNDSNTNEIKVNTSDWSSGVYYYLLIDGNNNKATGKISVINER